VNSGEIRSLYARRRASTPTAGHWPALRPATRVCAPLEDGEVIGFKGREGRIQHFPTRYDDDVDADRYPVTPEQLP
jgi:hypothetical protein